MDRMNQGTGWECCGQAEGRLCGELENIASLQTLRVTLVPSNSKIFILKPFWVSLHKRTMEEGKTAMN